MACRATLTRIDKTPGMDQYLVQFSDGSGLNGTREDILAFMGQLYDNPDMAKAAALGKAYAQDPNFIQINSVLGKAVVLDANHNNSIRIDPNDTGTGLASLTRTGRDVA